jgi:hypothetical protein
MLWIDDNFLTREPAFHQQLVSGQEVHKVYDVPPGSSDGSCFNFKKCLFGSIAPIVFYQQHQSNSCMISSLASALLHIGDTYAAKYVIKRKQEANDALEVGRMNFCEQLMKNDHTRQIGEQRIKYTVKRWKLSDGFDIFHNISEYPTVCRLIDKKGGTNHCVTVCGDWVFDSNFEKCFPLSTKWMHFICNPEANDEDGFSGVMDAIRAIPPKIIQLKMNTNK